MSNMSQETAARHYLMTEIVRLMSPDDEDSIFVIPVYIVKIRTGYNWGEYLIAAEDSGILEAIEAESHIPAGAAENIPFSSAWGGGVFSYTTRSRAKLGFALISEAPECFTAIVLV